MEHMPVEHMPVAHNVQQVPRLLQGQERGKKAGIKFKTGERCQLQKDTMLVILWYDKRQVAVFSNYSPNGQIHRAKMYQDSSTCRGGSDSGPSPPLQLQHG